MLDRRLRRAPSDAPRSARWIEAAPPTPARCDDMHSDEVTRSTFIGAHIQHRSRPSDSDGNGRESMCMNGAGSGRGRIDASEPRSQLPVKSSGGALTLGFNNAQR